MGLILLITRQVRRREERGGGGGGHGTTCEAGVKVSPRISIYRDEMKCFSCMSETESGSGGVFFFFFFSLSLRSGRTTCGGKLLHLEGREPCFHWLQ